MLLITIIHFSNTNEIIIHIKSSIIQWNNIIQNSRNFIIIINELSVSLTSIDFTEHILPTCAIGSLLTLNFSLNSRKFHKPVVI